jgi:hypothetical protein
VHLFYENKVKIGVLSLHGLKICLVAHGMQNKIAKNIANILLGDLSFLTAINETHKARVHYWIRCSREWMRFGLTEKSFFSVLIFVIYMYFDLALSWIKD